MLSPKWINDNAVEVGLDEAGRGSLWGRLYVGAVILSPEDDAYCDDGAMLRQIMDSKKLTRRRRAILADYIYENAIEAVVAWAEPAEIDAVNVLNADMAAMNRALAALETPFERVLVDGNVWIPSCPVAEAAEAIVLPGGDNVSLSVAAASIIAKEAHDAWVRETATEELDARYGLLSNMGYGTATHLAGLKTWGSHSLHRRSFAPVGAVTQGVAPVGAVTQGVAPVASSSAKCF